MKNKQLNNGREGSVCRVLAYLCIVSSLLVGAGSGFADDFEDVQGQADSLQSQQVQEGQPEAGIEGIDSPADNQGDQSDQNEQAEFLNRLDEELNISKSEYYQITQNIRETRNRIGTLRDDMSELQNQLTYFDDQIAVTNEKLFTVIKQIIRVENEIRILYNDIEIKEVALKYQKELLKDYIRELYVYGDTYLDVDENGEIDAFKLLLADGNTGEVLKEIKYLGILEETGDRLVAKLDELMQELTDAQTSLEGKKLVLEDLEVDLRAKQEHLSAQKAAKENMLVLSRNQDEIYRALLQQSLEEQQEALAEIQAFKETIAFIEQKIVEEGDTFDISEYEDMVDKRFMTLYEFQRMPSDGSGFIWPVMPERGLSAYFHDPSYRGYFGVQHNAVDIRAGQGTPIRAPLDGVVYAAADNDYGYSYIMLVHHDDLMTTYGHINNIMVEEGQVVAAGEVIGLSGGMPGTKGAGYMTTGPHLHFEVMQNGAYVDALRFLPLEVLTAEHMEELPDEYLDDWERAVLGSEMVKVVR